MPALEIITTILTMASIELLPAGVMMQVELSGKMMKLLRVLGVAIILRPRHESVQR